MKLKRKNSLKKYLIKMGLKKLLILILFFILFLIEPEKSSLLNKSSLIYYVLCYIFAIVLHLSIIKHKNWFRLDLLFLISIFIAFFVIPITYILTDYFPSFVFYGTKFKYYVNYGTWLVVLGVYSWLIGFHFFVNKSINNINSSNLLSYKYFSKKLLYISLLLFILILLLNKEIFMGGNYNGAENWSSLTRYIYSIFSITIVMSTLFIFLDNHHEVRNNFFSIFSSSKLYIFLITIYIVIFLFILGDRGSILQLASTILFIYALIVRPISFKSFLILIAIGAIVMTIVGLGRNTGENIINKGYSSLEKNISTGNEPALYTLTKDLSSTARIFYKSLEHVPEKHDYFYGKTMLSDILSPIPFLNSIFIQITEFNETSLREFSTADYITYLIQGKFNKWGEGSNLLGEIYINFGKFGILVILFLLGIFFKKIHIEIHSFNNINYLLIATILSSYIIYLPRSSLFGILKPIIWSLIIYLLFIKKERKI